MSLKSPVIIKATAPQRPEEINDFVKELLTLIKNNISLDNLTERNCKVVLVELITNAIKHAKVESTLEVYLDDSLIKISKIDFGPKFEREDVINSTVTNNYEVERINEKTIVFKHREHRANKDLKSVPENFGFEIIAKACKSLTYIYDPDKKENIFTAVIKA